MQLASRFASRSPVLRSECPLLDDQIRAVAPSIFAEAPHESRSQRYSYIPTATVLQELRGEGFEPFMVCQTRVRADDRRDYTKHMIRLRHASQINGREANEIILLNSHDGTSSYQMLAGMFRFVCQNGLVCGDTVADVRVPHKGDVAAHVIEGAYEVLHGFDRAQEARDAMQAITLDAGESEVFARAALALKYDDDKPAPITESQILLPRRHDDSRRDLWSVFNRTQENLIKGGLSARAANGRRQTTRPVQGIDNGIRLNRALWLLADGLRRDLFAEGDAGTYLTDAALLETLVRGKLDAMAEDVRTEGWAWVEAVPHMSHADRQTFQSAPRQRHEPTARQARRIASLQTRLEKIDAELEDAYDAEDEDKAGTLESRREQVAEELQAVEDALQGYAPEVRAVAGAIVTLDREGEAVIYRGLLREAEAKAMRTLEKLRQGFVGENANDDEGDEPEAPKTASMSDRLAQRLSAHRTAALQVEVARHPLVALAALVHGMVQTVLQNRYHGNDLPLGVSLKVQDRLESLAPDVSDSPAAVALRTLQEVAGEALPEDSADLFAVLLAKSQDELVRLLAVCVASTVDVVTPRATQNQPGAGLAQAVELDMAAWWKPTAEGYFQHVPKAVILEAVNQYAPAHVTRLSKLKKGDIASEAERLADGTAWMPAVFQTGHHTEPEGVPEAADEADADAPEATTSEEEAHALAA